MHVCVCVCRKELVFCWPGHLFLLRVCNTVTSLYRYIYIYLYYSIIRDEKIKF